MLKVNKLHLGIGEKDLIQNLSFELNQPTFIAIIGHNGCGKTSLLNAIANLLPYKGEIFLSSKPSYLTQINTLQFDITAKELAVMGKFSQKRFLENYSKADYLEVEAVFSELGILGLTNKTVLSLSGGEQQLVWLAQLLLQNRTLLLLDEPTQSLDLRNKKKFFTLITTLVTQQAKTILCVTHDLLNLYSMEGYILNLSDPHPALEQINNTTLDKHISFLEK